MDKISASSAKQNFGDLLLRAAVAPVAIERHGKTVAAMVPPAWLERSDALDERRRARDAQRRVEQDRLLQHQRIGIELLGRAERRKALLGAARSAVGRWASEGLCSQEYIDRWNAWLALPVPELVEQMCSDAGGWGAAMRQNSPFGAIAR